MAISGISNRMIRIGTEQVWMVPDKVVWGRAAG